MREYDEAQQKLQRVVCNGCGKDMEVENGILMEGSFHSDWMFGYFSKRDREKHDFDLCEDCYERITREFAVPPTVTVVTELL